MPCTRAKQTSTIWLSQSSSLINSTILSKSLRLARLAGEKTTVCVCAAQANNVSSECANTLNANEDAPISQPKARANEAAKMAMLKVCAKRSAKQCVGHRAVVKTLYVRRVHGSIDSPCQNDEVC